ncbi:MOSC domain-containing protein [Natronococcus sp. JC468]|uniref:MOSC domain-containing protein n=1 Tax=Natronococcus sp. JC468 TaxID=1961921 RepID=UPI00143BBC8D|nr:MOSC N-terminal beta barrel domain-containing protein [Natronococcus sp. JC468]NKE34909.1 MOSC domain-containing protein [Natronococcus sp. JC468]
MARVDRLRVYPIKGLDGIELERAELVAGGTLARDREFRLVDADGAVVNGKRTARVHDLETGFDPETGEFTAESADSDRRRFDLEDDPERAADWFGEVFDLEVTLERDPSLGFVDRREMGPSVISTATLETVADWFDGLTVESVRRRMRANVEVAGVEPFWEDRFVGADAPSFLAGDVRFDGVTPCGRCVVPQRDPDTGEPTPEFRERFVERRRETFPEWADEDAFDHYYTLMLIAAVPERHRERTLRTGDSVEVVGE